MSNAIAVHQNPSFNVRLDAHQRVIVDKIVSVEDEIYEYVMCDIIEKSHPEEKPNFRHIDTCDRKKTIQREVPSSSILPSRCLGTGAYTGMWKCVQSEWEKAGCPDFRNFPDELMPKNHRFKQFVTGAKSDSFCIKRTKSGDSVVVCTLDKIGEIELVGMDVKCKVPNGTEFTVIITRKQAGTGFSYLAWFGFNKSVVISDSETLPDYPPFFAEGVTREHFYARAEPVSVRGYPLVDWNTSEDPFQELVAEIESREPFSSYDKDRKNILRGILFAAKENPNGFKRNRPEKLRTHDDLIEEIVFNDMRDHWYLADAKRDSADGTGCGYVIFDFLVSKLLYGLDWYENIISAPEYKKLSVESKYIFDCLAIGAINKRVDFRRNLGDMKIAYSLNPHLTISETYDELVASGFVSYSRIGNGNLVKYSIHSPNPAVIETSPTIAIPECDTKKGAANNNTRDKSLAQEKSATKKKDKESIKLYITPSLKESLREASKSKGLSITSYCTLVLDASIRIDSERLVFVDENRIGTVEKKPSKEHAAKKSGGDSPCFTEETTEETPKKEEEPSVCKNPVLPPSPASVHKRSLHLFHRLAARRERCGGVSDRKG